MKTTATNPATLCARTVLGASPVEDEAVVLLLAVDVDAPVLVEVWLVTVPAVDPVLEEVLVPVELTPGPETTVFPAEGVAAPVTTLPVPVCPLHVAFPAESLPQVSPAATLGVTICAPRLDGGTHGSKS
jgi:hypothetical protein